MEQLMNDMVQKQDEQYIERCLQLAELGIGNVAPNPLVGALVVYKGEIVGEGYHQKYGQPHAEPNAINAVADHSIFSEATLYVSLEPCSHYGKTPPCANLIVSKGFKKVVIGTLDPNPKVAGRGVEILRKAGIKVVVGVLEDKCRALNKRFFRFQETKRPFVLLKWAQTSDGFIDHIRTNIEQKPLLISNSITSQLTHKMRSENQSILVSTNTVVLDNPSLTVRNWSGKSPIRLVLDRTLRIPRNYQIYNNKQRTIVFTEKNEINENVAYKNIAFGEDCIKNLLQAVYELNIHSILVEGGAKLLNSFIESGWWDEANIEISSKCIGAGVKAPCIKQQWSEHKTFSNHKWINITNYQTKSL